MVKEGIIEIQIMEIITIRIIIIITIMATIRISLLRKLQEIIIIITITIMNHLLH